MSQKEEIRLVMVRPGAYDDDLKMDLVRSKISNGSYLALSYVWGSEISPRKAYINGVPKSLTTNLDCALRHLRDPELDLILWCDALCIHQADILERNQQVQMMGKIYSSALNVVIWLGPEAEDDSFALAYITQYCRPDSDSESVRLFRALDSICGRSWFFRVWVVQELALSRQDPIVCLGPLQMLWSQFHSYIDAILNDRESHKDIDLGPDHSFAAIESLLEKMRQVKELNEIKSFVNTSKPHLWDLMHRTTKSASTDPRDKVFGLLGVSHFSGKGIKPDYSKTVQDVYSETTALILSEGKPTVYCEFQLVGVREEYSDNPDLTPVSGLPSWVPDFTSSRITKPEEIMRRTAYRSPGKFVCGVTSSGEFVRWPMIEQLCTKLPLSAPAMSFSKDWKQLYTFGAHIGTISRTSGALLDLKWDESPDGVYFDTEPVRDIYHTIANPMGVTPLNLLRALVLGATYDPGDKKSRPLTSDDGALFEAYLMEEDRVLATRGPEFQSILLHIATTSRKRTLVFTENGRVGLSYHPDPIGGIRQGDLIVGLFGINFPFILRPSEDGTYRMVNVIYVVDHMWGHDFVQNAPPDATWKDFEAFGLKEYKIV